MDRLDIARKLDSRVRVLLSRSFRAEALVASLLESMDRLRLYLALGFKNLNAYARSVADWDATKTSRIVNLVRHLKRLPKMRRAFFAGELAWTKACITAPVAARTPSTDALWTERTRNESREQLAQLVAQETNEPIKHRITLELTQEQKAWLDDAIAAIQRESDRLYDPGPVIAEICRRFVTGEGATATGSRPLVAIGVCEKCDSVTHGEAQLEKADAESTLCDAEVVDFTKVPAARSRTIPVDVVTKVLARDQGRCRVPGCTNRTWIQLHHEGGWRNVQHDPERLVSLCSSHHRARHEELLKIVFGTRRATFTLADGSLLGEVDLHVLPVAPAQRRTQQASASDAEQALVMLGFEVRDAEKLVAAVGPCATTEALLKAALQHTPAASA